MALIHEKLYRSDDLARIDFAGYVRNLTTSLVRSYRAGSGPIALKTDISGVSLGIDTAVPCGLIINELISNALKYAFPPGWHEAQNGDGQTSGDGNSNSREAEIRVELRPDQDHHLTLTVADNGVGFPEGVDFQDTESLGMRLVNTLVNQLFGTVELECNGGTTFRISFPMPEEKQSHTADDQASDR
jgi:two-component sensor histidine kinase